MFLSHGYVPYLRTKIHDGGFTQRDNDADRIVQAERLVQLRKSGKIRVVTLDFGSTSSFDGGDEEDINIVGVRAHEDLSLNDFYDQSLVFEQLQDSSSSRIRFRHGDLCLASPLNYVWAKPCTNKNMGHDMQYLIENREDGAFFIRYPREDSAEVDDCVGSLPSHASLSRQPCDSENVVFDKASRPVRLSPGDNRDLCLKAKGSGSSSLITLARCDPSDEDQKFTYIFGIKRWVQQKKVRNVFVRANKHSTNRLTHAVGCSPRG